MSKLEQEWSSFHHLVQSSLHSVAETYEVVMGIMHRFRPKFLCLLEGPPAYYNEYEFKHTCVLAPGKIEGNLSTFEVDPEIAGDICTEVCVAEPYVDLGSFGSSLVQYELTDIIKEIRIQCVQPNYANPEEASKYQLTTETPVCKFFVKGMCIKGSNCLFSHSSHVKRELCKNYLTLKGCHYGDACWFSHEIQVSEGPETQEHVEFGDEMPSAISLLELLPETGEHDQDCIFIFGESEFRFASNLGLLYDPNKIVVATINSEMESMKVKELTGIGVKFLWNFHPFQFTRDVSIPWNKVKCILWTATLFGRDEELESQIDLLKSFFEFLALKFLTQVIYNVQVILTIENSKYAQFQVERMARDSFFFLRLSFPFDNSTFACFPKEKEKERDVPPSKPISYVFEFQPPTDILFGDYTFSLTEAIGM